MANDRNFLDELGLDAGEDYGAGQDFSLESILAEYKGSAYMDGDKRTPPEELQRKTDDIIRQAMGQVRGSPAQSASGSAPDYTPQESESRTHPSREAPITRRQQARSTQQSVNEDAREGDGYEEYGEYEEYEEESKRGLFGRAVRGRRSDDRHAEREYDEGYARERETRRQKPARHTPKIPPEEFSEPAYDEAPEIDTSVFDEPETPKTAAYPGERSRFNNNIYANPERSSSGAQREDRMEYSRPDAVQEFADEVRETEEEGEYEEEADERGRRRGIFGLFSRRRSEEDEEFDDEEDWEDEPEYIDDDDYFDVEPEPDFKEEAGRFAAKVPSLRFRIFGAGLICVIMGIITHAFTTSGSGPFGIGENAAICTGVLVIMELVVMALGIDVLIRGLEDLIRLEPGAETLVFISCAGSVLDAFNMLLRGNYDNGLPLAIISSVSLLGAMSARKSYYMAICDSLRASKAAKVTYGVTADFESMEGRHILKKVTGTTDGFYTKLVYPDVGERFYGDIAPLFVVAAFVMAFLASVGRGNVYNFAHCFSILTAAAAAFPAAVLFALPFKYAASNLKKAGGALAGFAGAKDIFYTDGALITDLDIFPTGSVSLSGIKLFEGVNAQKVVVDTASLIIASDSGLRKVFEELLKSQGLTRRRTDDFACYDGGGIGALVDGERVLVGTGAFMNLMGIRVPDNVNTVNTLFTAINDELGGAFSLNYVPANSVQSALVALLGTNTNLLMAVRDFNVTPNTVKQKFKVSMDGVEYLPIETTYDLSQNSVVPGAGVSAILCRGGLAPFAEVITRGRLLKLITELNTWVTAIGTVMGFIISFFLCWTGAFASASAENIFIFMAVIGIAVYIMSQGTRRRIK